MRQLSAPTTPDDDAPSAAERVQGRVDAAAFALLREGKNPTVALVRSRMGGGSPNLVAPALQRWRLTFAAHLDENAGSALEILPPGVLELVQALWSRALFEAHRVRADSPSAAEAMEQLNAAIRELLATTTRLQDREAALDAQQRELDVQRRRVASAEEALTRRLMARPTQKTSTSQRPKGSKSPTRRPAIRSSRRVRPKSKRR